MQKEEEEGWMLGFGGSKKCGLSSGFGFGGKRRGRDGCRMVRGVAWLGGMLLLS